MALNSVSLGENGAARVKVGDSVCACESGKCYFSEMWQDLGGLGSVGVNSGVHQADQFGTTGKGFVDKFDKFDASRLSLEQKPMYIHTPRSFSS
ncbi:hypothetical protein P5V15_006482 [Pogonomyrmex californicus]